MSWFTKFFTSSIGQKVLMSLTGLFLTIFLLVHLAGNMQLLSNDGGEAFNIYSKFMTTNPVIKTTSYLLYFSILLHAIQGIVLWMKNRAARGSSRYAVEKTRAVNTNARAAKTMAWLGILILIFLVIHMGDFWFKMKFGSTGKVMYDGTEYKNLYELVEFSFKNPLIVGFYVLAMIGLAFHLLHGVQSAFQSLGLNHKKYSPLIRFLGKAVAIVVPAMFAVIPIIFYFTK